LLRTTSTQYQAFSNSNYLNNNLLDLVSQKSAFAGNSASGACNSNGAIACTTYSYDEQTPSSSGITMQHDSSPPAGTYRGNQTSIHRWLNGSTVSQSPCNVAVSNGYLVSNNYFYDTGEVQKSTDPCGYPTTYSYSSSSPYYGAFLTTVTNALNQITSYTYDANTGLVTSITDPNLQPTRKQYDNMARLTLISYPDGGSTGYCYTDNATACTPAAPPHSVVITKAINSSVNETSAALFDGLGRLFQTQLTSDPEGTDYVDTTYDALGRKSTVSNPHRSSGSSTDGVTTYVYDALGRVCVVGQPDGTAVTQAAGCPLSTAPAGDIFTQYSGNCTAVTDEAGHTRESCVDGLGRMTSVLEDPGSSPHLNYLTTYTYDALNNLQGVVQNGSSGGTPRSRTFQYDSLSHLTSAANPESGTIQYAYDADGNVATKTDARAITTSYTYDQLNRLTSKSYSDGSTPTAYLQYDTPLNWGTPPFPQENVIGRLSGAGIGPQPRITAEIFSYDAMGRVLVNPQCSPSTCGTSSFLVYDTYDLAGNLTSTTNAAGTVLTYGPYDGASRLTTITSTLNDTEHPPTLYTVDPSLGYWPTGEIRKAQFGNKLTESVAFNNRLQPCRMNVNSTAAYFSQCSDGTPAGNILDLTMGYNSGTDNGNVASWSAVGQQTFSRTYAYDSLNRIQSMADSVTTQPCQGMSWTIDAWGNMTNQTGTKGTCNNFSSSVGTNNQLQSGYTYDAAGNMTYDGFHHYTYDAENRITAVDSGSTASYVYNENGKRVRKNTGSNFTEYIYGPNGEVQEEWDGTDWPYQYVYAGNKLIAEYTDTTTRFIQSDHLGSTRLVTGVSKVVQDNMDYLPYGQEVTGASTTTHKFTGKERDSESGLDNFGARYDASTMGRFMTPDPLGGHLEDPQTLNKYAYVRNNPTTLTDPTGLDIWLQGCGKENTSTCQNNYVGTTDKDGNFTRTHLTGDQTSDATLGAHGISVTQDGKTYEGVWDTNKGENGAVTVAGAAGTPLEGYDAKVTGNCGNTCVASGSIFNASNPNASTAALFSVLDAKGSGYVKEAGLDFIDKFHPGATNFRGHTKGDPHGIPSTHIPIDPKASTPQLGFHIDKSYPYDSPGDFAEHTGSVIHTLWNQITGQQ
jgi:RHS repeat-associated protein